MFPSTPLRDDDDEPSGPVRLRVPAGLFAIVLVLAPLIAVLAVHQVRARPLGTPQATVRSFLDAAAVNRDGERACDFLTVRGRLSFERTAARPTCERFFASSALSLGGPVRSNRDLGELSYRLTDAGAARRVTVTRGGQQLVFVLRPGTPPERGEFRAPPTPWRIASVPAFRSLSGAPGTLGRA